MFNNNNNNNNTNTNLILNNNDMKQIIKHSKLLNNNKSGQSIYKIMKQLSRINEYVLMFLLMYCLVLFIIYYAENEHQYNVNNDDNDDDEDKEGVAIKWVVILSITILIGVVFIVIRLGTNEIQDFLSNANELTIITFEKVQNMVEWEFGGQHRVITPFVFVVHVCITIWFWYHSSDDMDKERCWYIYIIIIFLLIELPICFTFIIELYWSWRKRNLSDEMWFVSTRSHYEKTDEILDIVFTDLTTRELMEDMVNLDDRIHDRYEQWCENNGLNNNNNIKMKLNAGESNAFLYIYKRFMRKLESIPNSLQLIRYIEMGNQIKINELIGIVNPNSRIGEEGETALIAAVRARNVNVVESLLENGADHLLCYHLKSPLVSAEIRGYDDIVDVILSHKSFNINKQNDRGETELMLAIKCDCRNLIKKILNREMIKDSSNRPANIKDEKLNLTIQNDEGKTIQDLIEFKDSDSQYDRLPEGYDSNYLDHDDNYFVYNVFRKVFNMNLKKSDVIGNKQMKENKIVNILLKKEEFINDNEDEKDNNEETKVQYENEYSPPKKAHSVNVITSSSNTPFHKSRSSGGFISPPTTKRNWSGSLELFEDFKQQQYHQFQEFSKWQLKEFNNIFKPITRQSSSLDEIYSPINPEKGVKIMKKLKVSKNKRSYRGHKHHRSLGQSPLGTSVFTKYEPIPNDESKQRNANPHSGSNAPLLRQPTDIYERDSDVANRASLLDVDIPREHFDDMNFKDYLINSEKINNVICGNNFWFQSYRDDEHPYLLALTHIAGENEQVNESHPYAACWFPSPLCLDGIPYIGKLTKFLRKPAKTKQLAKRLLIINLLMITCMITFHHIHNDDNQQRYHIQLSDMDNKVDKWILIGGLWFILLFFIGGEIRISLKKKKLRYHCFLCNKKRYIRVRPDYMQESSESFNLPV